jgi:hypothetical protein
VKHLALAILLLAGFPAAAAASPAGKAAAYLESLQAPGGCIGSWQTTGWAAIALKAGGHGTSSRRAAGCLAGHAGEFVAGTDLELGIMAAVAGGRSARSFGGRDLLRDLAAMRHGGYYATSALTNSSIFGILALRSLGRRVPHAVMVQVVRDQSSGGGWDFFPEGGQADMTAAGIEALRAAGYSCSRPPVRRAFAFLRRLRNRDGGFPYASAQPSNSQSTAWVVQAYAACGHTDRRGLAFLRSHQAADGGIAYGPSGVGRDWVTAQALPALRLRPLPVR